MNTQYHVYQKCSEEAAAAIVRPGIQHQKMDGKEATAKQRRGEVEAANERLSKLAGRRRSFVGSVVKKKSLVVNGEQQQRRRSSTPRLSEAQRLSMEAVRNVGILEYGYHQRRSSGTGGSGNNTVSAKLLAVKPGQKRRYVVPPLESPEEEEGSLSTLSSSAELEQQQELELESESSSSEAATSTRRPHAVSSIKSVARSTQSSQPARSTPQSTKRKPGRPPSKQLKEQAKEKQKEINQALQEFNRALHLSRQPPRLGQIPFRATLLDSPSFYIALYLLYRDKILCFDDIISIAEKWGENLSMYSLWTATNSFPSFKLNEGGLILSGESEVDDGCKRMDLFDDDSEEDSEEEYEEEVIRKWRGTEAGCRLQNLRWEGKLTDGDIRGFIGRWWRFTKEKEQKQKK
ncbi:hypothetical protein QBC38DRAFT_501273 [Podospora fimiseda]|uniref:Uncharacterized protein n=1 Tax=Podospora fimiseda TaxID=252190 RepID=A0AAN7GV22_9PEZI|nr:hypothetical protein QBC38DRAFT_501273 [Podospora fimiseda]